MRTGSIRREESMKEEFYTQKRWLNWMNKVKESQFRLPESEQDAAGAVFVYIMDDVILACLKVIARFEKGILSQDDALATIRSIRDIVSAEHESLGEDADMMLSSLRTSLAAVFESCNSYILGDYDRDRKMDDMIHEAMEAEAEGRIEDALAVVGNIGARVIAGEKPPEIPDMDYCIVAELLDGIDAIAAAMVGDTSYKEEDGSPLEEEI
ncbi:DUF2150 family protein [Methanothrix sp.]|uniref:DUF2150 family protein n=1 Tax=Methanothrix sp. TaxID=90426 RepID=UPI003C72180E